MERNVRVNALPASEDDNAVKRVPRPSRDERGDESGPRSVPLSWAKPAGQRCGERAFEGGFCAKHRPGARPPIVASTKVVAASAGIIGLLWPYLADLVREIIRLIHSQ